MKWLTERNEAIGALVLVAFGYSILSVVSRWLSLGYEPFTQVYLRLLGALLMAGILFRKKIRWQRIKDIPKSDYKPLLVMGVFGYGLMVYFVSLGALNTSLLKVSIIMAMVPFFSYVMGIFFLKDKFDIKVTLLAFLSLYGVSVLAGNSIIPNISGFGKGELFVLISAFLLATYSVSRKLLSTHLNNQEITMVVMFLAFITTLLLAIVKGEKMELANLAIPLVFFGFILGSTLNIVCTFLESFAFQRLEVVVGNQILLLENLFSPVLGYFLYKEGLGLWQIIGAVVIIGSVYLNNKHSLTK
ncbi:MAG: DMT family transporter [Candidatus Shapirobacteria bacterium]|jgi:drug/metabolite transporter (DMT)-like permease